MIWRKRNHSRIVQVADFLTVAFSLVFAYFLTAILHDKYPDYFPQIYNFHSSHYFLIIFICSTYIFLFSKQKAYSYQRFTSIFKEYLIVFRICCIGSIFSISLVYVLGLREIPRTYFVIFFLISTFFLLIEKTLLFIVAAYIRNSGEDRKRLLIIGTGHKAKSIIDIVNVNFKWGLDIIGLVTCDKEEAGTVKYGYKILDNIDNLEFVIKKVNPQEVIVTLSISDFNFIRDVLIVCGREGLRVRLNSDFFGKIIRNVTIDNVYGLNIITFDTLYQSEYLLMIKRFIDVFISIIALIFLAPILILTSILIWFTDGRPIFYDWNVVGLDKKPFKSWKFRTMVKNADKLKDKLSNLNEMNGPVFKIKNDPRIIPVGRFLRKYSIDEIPQLFSVIKGDMSLVGPRPAGPHELERYESWHRRKLSIKPGITCLWQVNGRNNINSFDDWVKLDLEYIDNWSILLDIKILIKTIPAVIRGKGAS